MSTDPQTMAILSGPCQWCSGYHTGVCPRVKSIEYDQFHQIRRVEFHEPTPGPTGGER